MKGKLKIKKRKIEVFPFSFKMKKKIWAILENSIEKLKKNKKKNLIFLITARSC